LLLFDSHQQLKRAYDLARGRTMVAMVFLWTIIFYYAMKYGRRMREAGYSIEKEGQARLDKLQEKGRLERETEAKKPEV